MLASAAASASGAVPPPTGGPAPQSGDGAPAPPPPSPRYLLIFPQGGVVDIVARVQAGFKFCVKTNRVLVVDTTRTQFGVPLEHYLRFLADCVHFQHRKDPTDQQELDAQFSSCLLAALSQIRTVCVMELLRGNGRTSSLLP